MLLGEDGRLTTTNAVQDRGKLQSRRPDFDSMLASSLFSAGGRGECGLILNIEEAASVGSA
jgi:hypothetical protein